MKTLGFSLTAALVLTLNVTAYAQGPVISSFHQNGELRCADLIPGSTCTVEWASSMDGPWTNNWDRLHSVVADTNGAITVGVPMFYRVRGQAVPAGMVLIPGGTNAGTDPDFGAYSLTVASFYMDRYEVTKALWDEVRNWNGGNGYGYDNNLDGEGSHGRGKAAEHPVHTVNWYDCVKWCNARSQKEGRTPVYYTDAEFTQVFKTGQVLEPYVKASAAGYRLPTDTQWEYAARGGVAGRRFPWSDSDTIQHARANYYSRASYGYDTSPTRGYHPTYNEGVDPYTSAVGSFTANGYGLYDMAGNVWEWCYDWYPGFVGSVRVGRGGGWILYAGDCRVANRGGSYPDGAYYTFGFRVVLPPGQP